VRGLPLAAKDRGPNVLHQLLPSAAHAHAIPLGGAPKRHTAQRHVLTLNQPAESPR
jgi:hypothetical protein